MDWIDNIFDEYEKKGAGQKPQDAEIWARKKQKDDALEKQFEQCVDALILPALNDIKERIEARGYQCKIDGPFARGGITREPTKAEVTLRVNKNRQLKKFDIFSASSIAFYTQQGKVKTVIRYKTNPPGETFMEIEDITKSRIQETVGDFLRQVFA